MVTSDNRRRQLASFLRKAPWLISLGLIPWRMMQPRFTAGVVGVVLDEQQRILLVEHVLHPHRPWGLPGGWIDHHEAPDDALNREFREELDLVVQVGPILCIERPFGNHLDMAYLCHTDGTVGKLSKELLAFDWFAPHELPRLYPFHRQAIEHALEYQRLLV